MIKLHWADVPKCNKTTSHVGTNGSLHREAQWT